MDEVDELLAKEAQRKRRGRMIWTIVGLALLFALFSCCATGSVDFHLMGR